MTVRNGSNEREVEKLVESSSYKGKDFDSKQEALMHLSVFYTKGKKIKLEKLYNEILGYSDGAVICGQCNRKGTIRKKGKYYEIRHSRGKKDICYIGRYPLDEITFIPTRIIRRSE